MKYSIVTFGCRVNQADSLAIEQDLRGRGAVPARLADADVVVVNTCSVTATADQGARQTIRRLARDNPAVQVIVTGCYATRRPEDVRELPNVLHVVPNQAKETVLEKLNGAFGPTTAERFAGGEGPCGLEIGPGAAGRTAFTLRVQTGCEERCSYCIIPNTRGSGRSLPPGEVIARLRTLQGAGYKEVALAGVHLGSYGRDLQPTSSLRELLEAIAGLDFELVFRISSLEPMDCTPEIVDLLARSGERFAPHFHLPLQHASDTALSRMRRPYTLRYYRQLVGAILSGLPDASIGSDLIAGFPGETEAEFAATLEFLPGSGLSHLHVFPYSDRPGTAATAMGNKVEPRVVRERAAALRQAGAELSARFRRSQIGRVRPALTLDDGSVVVTDNYLKLKIGPGLPRNVRVTVRVEDEVAATVVGGGEAV